MSTYVQKSLLDFEIKGDPVIVDDRPHRRNPLLDRGAVNRLDEDLDRTLFNLHQAESEALG